MATLGSVKYGAAKYGAAGQSASVDAFQALYGADVLMRRACVELWEAHASTLAGVAALPHYQEARRQAALADSFLQEETLTFAVADPAEVYWPGGVEADVLTPGALVRPRWEVTTPGGTETRWGLPYRVLPVPNAGQDSLGPGLLAVAADDWCRAALSQALPDASLTPLRQLVALKDDMVTNEGMPNPGDTYMALCLAVAWYVSDGRASISSTWQSPTYPTGSALAEIVDAPVNPSGDALTGRQALAWLYPSAPFRLFYVPTTGYLELRGGTGRRDSGYVLSDGTAVPGAGPFVLPWERLTPNPQRPDWTSAEWWYRLESGGVVTSTLLAEYASPHPRFPDSGVYARRHVTIDRAGVGAATAQQAVQTRVLDAIGAADRWTVELDSAIPPPPLGDEIRVYDPPRINAWYAVVQVTQPLGDAGPQTWVLAWRGEP